MSPDVAWDFFSAPANLCLITPPHMGFEITSGVPPRMYAGQIISYRVGVFPGIRVNWVSEITQVQEPRYFVDEQRCGPYRMWHHEHWLLPTDDGKLLMKDVVSYQLPGGWLGRLLQPLVGRELIKIFTFRQQTLAAQFPP